MTKNREDYKDLCSSIVEIMMMLQDEITQHGATAVSRLKQLCEKFEGCVFVKTFIDSAHSSQFATGSSARTWTYTEDAERFPRPC